MGQGILYFQTHSHSGSDMLGPVTDGLVGVCIYRVIFKQEPMPQKGKHHYMLGFSVLRIMAF